MKGFCDLPKPVREKIYRMHFVQDEPVKFSEFKAICNCTDDDEESNMNSPRIMPSILQISRKMEREGMFEEMNETFARIDKLTYTQASHIYFGENVFQIEGWKGFYNWFRRLWPRHVQQIRNIRLSEWDHKVLLNGDEFLASDFKKLKSLRLLESLIVVVDENEMFQRELRRLRYYDKWHDSLELGPQVQLQMMHVTGMAALRSLRGLRNVTFSHPKRIGQQGSIPGGFLESTVKREMMRPIDMRA